MIFGGEDLLFLRTSNTVHFIQNAKISLYVCCVRRQHWASASVIERTPLKMHTGMRQFVQNLVSSFFLTSSLTLSLFWGVSVSVYDCDRIRMSLNLIKRHNRYDSGNPRVPSISQSFRVCLFTFHTLFMLSFCLLLPRLLSCFLLNRRRFFFGFCYNNISYLLRHYRHSTQFYQWKFCELCLLASVSMTILASLLLHAQ